MKSFCHTPRHTESVTKVHLANLGPCYTRFVSLLNVQSRIKALPFQTLLAPSERYASKRGLRHKKLTDWARQGMLQTIRWLPDRKVIFVGDSSFGTHELANSISKHGTLISRLRLDANFF